MAYMQTVVAKSVAVKCNYCHNVKNYASDEKQHNLIAQEMMLMAQNIREDVIARLILDPITCWIRHRVSNQPERDSSDTKKGRCHKH